VTGPTGASEAAPGPQPGDGRGSLPGGLALLVPVLVAAVALAGVALRAPDRVPAAPTARSAPVDARTVTCFTLPGSRAASGLVVGTVDVPGPRGEVGAARVGVPGVVEPDLSLDAVGGWATATLPGSRSGSVDLEARGGAAPGLVAYGAVRAPDDLGGGLAVQQCAEPARRWWFVGAGSTAARGGAVVLHAPDDAGAVVDVVVRGEQGVLASAGGEDVRVGAGATEVLPLDELAAGASDVAVDVDASQGQVVAAVADTWGEGLEPEGTDWVPASTEPARAVVVPGVVDTGSTPVLVVANGGSRTVVARPSLLSEAGRVAPPDADSVRVPAGGVATVRLPRELDETGAVEVRADGPVTASVRIGADDDVAHPSGAAPLDEAAVLPVDLGAPVDTDVGLRLGVLLVDPDSQRVRTRGVRLTGFDADGAEVAAGSVRLGAGTALDVDLAEVLGVPARDLGDLAYVLVDATARDAVGAPLVGAAVVEAESGIAVQPLRPLVPEVSVPALVPGL